MVEVHASQECRNLNVHSQKKYSKGIKGIEKQAQDVELIYGIKGE